MLNLEQNLYHQKYNMLKVFKGQRPLKVIVNMKLLIWKPNYLSMFILFCVESEIDIECLCTHQWKYRNRKNKLSFSSYQTNFT